MNRNNQKLIMIFSVLPLFVAGVLIYQQVEQEITKRKFAQTEKKVKELSALLGDKLGVSSTTIKNTRNCQREQVKFGSGEMICSIGFEIKDFNDQNLQLAYDTITGSNFAKTFQEEKEPAKNFIDSDSGMKCYVEVSSRTKVYSFRCLEKVRKAVY